MGPILPITPLPGAPGPAWPASSGLCPGGGHPGTAPATRCPRSQPRPAVNSRFTGRVPGPRSSPHAIHPPDAGDISAHPQRPNVPTDPCAHRRPGHEFTRRKSGWPPDPHARHFSYPGLMDPDSARPQCRDPRLRTPAFGPPPSDPRLRSPPQIPASDPRPRPPAPVTPASISPVVPRASRTRLAPAPSRLTSRRTNPSSHHSRPLSPSAPASAATGRIAHIIPAFSGFPDRREPGVMWRRHVSPIAAKRSSAIPRTIGPGNVFCESRKRNGNSLREWAIRWQASAAESRWQTVISAQKNTFATARDSAGRRPSGAVRPARRQRPGRGPRPGMV
jgi:hypothetical protein